MFCRMAIAPLLVFQLAATLARSSNVSGVNTGQLSSCNESDTVYYIMGYSFMLNEEWRYKFECRLDYLTVLQVKGLQALLAPESLLPDVAECIKFIRSQKMLPVLISGVRRGWYEKRRGAANPVPEDWDTQALDPAVTSLGAVLDPSAEMYAVMHQMTAAELEEYEAHEHDSSGVLADYLDPESVTLLVEGDEISPCAKIRWFPVPEPVLPSAKAPISQSDVDLLIGGALDMAMEHGIEDFAAKVIGTTYGWSHFWINDRAGILGPWDAQAHAVTSALVAYARNASEELAPEASLLPVEALQPLSLGIMRRITLPTGMASEHKDLEADPWMASEQKDLEATPLTGQPQQDTAEASLVGAALVVTVCVGFLGAAAYVGSQMQCPRPVSEESSRMFLGATRQAEE